MHFFILLSASLCQAPSTKELLTDFTGNCFQMLIHLRDLNLPFSQLAVLK